MPRFRAIPVARLQDIQPERVCLIKPSSLGDIVQTLPVLAALRTRFPAGQLSWVVERSGPTCWWVILIWTKSFGSGIHGLRSWVRCWRICIGGASSLSWICRACCGRGCSLLLSIPIRVGLQTAREGSHWSCNCILPDTGRDVPAHARYRAWPRPSELLRLLGLPRFRLVRWTNSGRGGNWPLAARK